ncbi:MAG: ABC transporter permease, partial [Muribaculaceae bacterium]|nr:ABC transporter permease [Muribaculaceae bacterium]
MNYLRQVLFDLRHQKLMTWLSIIGTAIAIFLIMSDFMINNMDNVSVVPESKRARIVYGFGVHITLPNGSGSSYLSYDLAKELYEGLDGVELVTFSGGVPSQCNVTIRNNVPESFPLKVVDENYWKIYDYTFEEGGPFAKEEVEAGAKNAILSKSVAEKLFGKQDSYLGKEINLQNQLWIVTGIVKDVNPILDITYAGVFIPHVSAGYTNADNWIQYFGSYVPALLLKEGVSVEHIRKQVKNRYDKFNSRHKSENLQLVYHQQPWNLEEYHEGVTNLTPSLAEKHRLRIIAYFILLLIPAINLSSMTRSRMQQRVSQIGLCRAFGCTRMRIIFDLLTENLILTLIGGIIGLIFCVVFIIVFSNYFIAYGGWMPNSLEILSSRPTFTMLFSWKAFGAI